MLLFMKKIPSVCFTETVYQPDINLIHKNRTVDEICGALRNLVSLVQFKKREKHPQRSVTFSEVAG